MKQNERIIRTGDYYELETIEDLMMQQKIVKKQQPQSTTNIPPPPPTNIETALPSRKEAMSSYFVPASASIRTEDFGLTEYQNSLEYLLSQGIKDEQRLQIEKLLKEIQQIKQDTQLPLNNLPEPKPYSNEGAKNVPKQINLQADIKIDHLQKQIAELQGLKFMQLSRLQHLIDILLGEIKSEAPTPQATQVDEKVKGQMESVYNNLNSLTCLKTMPSIINKIAANEIKFEQMREWVLKTEEISDLNKEIRDEFEHDQAVLKQLQVSFKENAQKVRQAIQKLSQ